MVNLLKNSKLTLMLSLVIFLYGQVYTSKAERFCGQKLVNTLEFMCEVYPGLAKRNKDLAVSPKDSEMDQIVTPGRMKNVPSYWVKHFPSTTGIRMVEPDAAGENDVEIFGQDRFQQWKRAKGVVDECCLKPCTMDYLVKNYCLQ